MEQFRPNLVVTGAQRMGRGQLENDPHRQRHFRRGEAVQPLHFYHGKSERGQKHPSGEPLKTLQSFRTAQDNGDVDFGQNLIAAQQRRRVAWAMRLKCWPAGNAAPALRRR